MTEPEHSADDVRPGSDRSAAIEAASTALMDTNWRAWGALTVARKVVKAMEAAGFKVVPK